MSKEKELSSTDKRRRTTLRKKSVDELVNIVLRKDDVERKLQKSIETFKNLQENNDKRIAILKDSLAKSEEIQVSQEQTINSYSDVIGSLKATIVHKDEVIADVQKELTATESEVGYYMRMVEARKKNIRACFIIILVLLMSLTSIIIL